jgi:hypothetical protein
MAIGSPLMILSNPTKSAEMILFMINVLILDNG